MIRMWSIPSILPNNVEPQVGQNARPAKEPRSLVTWYQVTDPDTASVSIGTSMNGAYPLPVVRRQCSQWQFAMNKGTAEHW
jgi:hypothetical protein